jgi:hypothetical protein
MQAAPNGFNEHSSLLPDIKTSIHGVQGGGGLSTFLKDFLVGSKGLPIQYKNRGDTDFKTYTISDIPDESDSDVDLESESDTEIEAEIEEAEPEITVPTVTTATTVTTKTVAKQLSDAQKNAIEKIQDIIIKGDPRKIATFKKDLIDVVNDTMDINSINEFVSLLPKINKKNITNLTAIQVTFAVTVSVDEPFVIPHLIRELKKL